MAGDVPAGYEEVPAPSNAPALGGPPAGYEEVQAPSQPGMLSRIWGAATTPLIPQGRAEREGLAEATSVPTLAESEHPILTGAKKGLAGAYADTLGMARSFTSPVSLALMGAGAASRALPVAGKVAGATRTALSGIEAGAGAGFGAQGASQIVGAGMENTPEAWQQRLQGAGQMVGGAAGAADVANRTLPGFKQPAGHFDAMEAAYGDRPVATNKSLPAAQATAKRLTENKAMAVPGPVQTILDKASGADLPPAAKPPKIMGEDAEVFASKNPQLYQQLVKEGAIKPEEVIGYTPKPQPMTFLQMRHLKTDLDNLINSREIAPSYKKPMVAMARAVHEDIVNSLPNQTAKNWYEATNKASSQAYAAQRAAEKVAPIAGGLAGYYGGRLIGAPLGAELTLGAIGHQMGKRVIGGMVDSVLNRDTGPISIPRGAIPPPPH